MVEVWLPYGDSEVHISVPLRYLAGTAEPPRGSPLENPFEALSEALKSPIEAEPLTEKARRGGKVAIALDGTMSLYAASMAASGIAWTLGQAEIPAERVTVVVGNGLREESDQRILEALSKTDALREAEIVEHRRDSENVVKVGTTSARTDVEVSREFAEAEIKVAVGEVFPDPFSGFRGAQSSVYPALATGGPFEHHRGLAFRGDVTPGAVEGNQVHVDQMEVCELIGVDLGVQLLTNGSGEILSVHAGSMGASFRSALEALGDSHRVEVEAGADIIVVSAGGARFDFDLYNAVWALGTVASLAKRGATIILLAECEEGLGADGFEALAAVDTVAELRRRYMLGARGVYTIKSALRRNEVVLVSTLPGYLAEPLGFTVERTANDAFQRVLERRRGRRTIAITHGCSTVPFVALEGEEGDEGEEHEPEVDEGPQLP